MDAAGVAQEVPFPILHMLKGGSFDCGLVCRVSSQRIEDA